MDIENDGNDIIEKKELPAIVFKEDFEKEKLRFLAETYYDHQKLRTSTMNRFRSLVKRRIEGLSLTKKEQKKEEDEKAYGKVWNDEEIKNWLEIAKNENKLDEGELEQINRLDEIAKASTEFEKKYKKEMSIQILTEPLYNNYLKKIRGIGDITSANLISIIGYCERFDTVSNLWAYAGLAVKDGKAQKRKKGELSNWNTRLKTLCWKISDSFIKQGDGYRKLYDQFKETYKNREDLKLAVDNKTKGAKMHIDLMARRKVVKLFLSHYWETARKMKGLPAEKTYVQGILKHNDIIKPFTDEKI